MNQPSARHARNGPSSASKAIAIAAIAAILEMAAHKTGGRCRRLVVTGSDAQGREIAEVVHEALIQKWGRFCEWMDADRAFHMHGPGNRAVGHIAQ